MWFSARHDDPPGINRDAMLLDDTDTERREHVGVKPRAGFQVLGDNSNVVKHDTPVTGSREKQILLRWRL
jgi:hypothetical protein